MFRFFYSNCIVIIQKKKIILASGSPRRKLLLQQVGLNFDVRVSNVNEEIDFHQSYEENVQRIALLKATSVADSDMDVIIVGADTIVVIDNNILGKPLNADDAIRMLSMLSGKTHKVYTGIALVDYPTKEFVTAVEMTSVTFRQLDTYEIEEYVKSGSPMDKAGAYGIQDDYGAVFIERIDGCFYNVVGFPLSRFYTTLKKFQERIGYR